MTVTRSQSSSTSSSLCDTKSTLIPSASELLQRGEELVALVGGDAGRRLIEDEHPGTQATAAG